MIQEYTRWQYSENSVMLRNVLRKVERDTAFGRVLGFMAEL